MSRRRSEIIRQPYMICSINYGNTIFFLKKSQDRDAKLLTGGSIEAG
jgi:hypothetical protein